MMMMMLILCNLRVIYIFEVFTYGSDIKRSRQFLHEFRAAPHSDVNKVFFGVAQSECPHATFAIVNCKN